MQLVRAVQLHNIVIVRWVGTKSEWAGRTVNKGREKGLGNAGERLSRLGPTQETIQPR